MMRMTTNDLLVRISLKCRGNGEITQSDRCRCKNSARANAMRAKSSILLQLKHRMLDDGRFKAFSLSIIYLVAHPNLFFHLLFIILSLINCTFQILKRFFGRLILPSSITYALFIVVQFLMKETMANDYCFIFTFMR